MRLGPLIAVAMFWLAACAPSDPATTSSTAPSTTVSTTAVSSTTGRNPTTTTIAAVSRPPGEAIGVSDRVTIVVEDPEG